MPRQTKPEAKRKQALKKRLSHQEKRQSYLEKLRRDQKKERDRILLGVIKAANGKGIYEAREFKLTKYRRSRANKVLGEFGELLDAKKFFFIKIPKKDKNKIVERAENLQIKHSKSGLFVPKEGHKRASIRYDRKHKEYTIERSGKTKRGPTKGVRYRTITPLASLDDITDEQQRLRDMAKAIGQLKRNQRLAFVVVENGFEGYSRGTFNHIELLLNYLENYKKTLAAKVNFYRHIEIVVTSSSAQWFADHPATSPGKEGRKQRDEIRKKNKGKYLQMRPTRANRKKTR